MASALQSSETHLRFGTAFFYSFSLSIPLSIFSLSVDSSPSDGASLQYREALRFGCGTQTPVCGYHSRSSEVVVLRYVHKRVSWNHFRASLFVHFNSQRKRPETAWTIRARQCSICSRASTWCSVCLTTRTRSCRTSAFCPKSVRRKKIGPKKVLSAVAFFVFLEVPDHNGVLQAKSCFKLANTNWRRRRSRRPGIR
jgi:hypothetical protein